MYTFFYLLIFILGLISGSFLNCVVYRLSVNDSFLKGRSHCPRCKKNIKPIDLIPVFSFLFLKGRCRHCSEKISWQYPIVEFLTGLLFLFIFVFYQNEIYSFQGIIGITYITTIFFIFLIVFIYDLKYFIIPDETVVSLITISFFWYLLNFLNGYFSFNEILIYFLSGVGASLFFLSFYLVSKGNWMGFGDVKIALPMGFFLGFPNIVIALFLSFVIGSIVGITMVLIGKKEIKSEIPFAPFLISGTFLAFFWGDFLLTSYLMFFTI
jgi:prepilin signal peptidase PulO-like enzyme (type II secretory pathway)